MGSSSQPKRARAPPSSAASFVMFFMAQPPIRAVVAQVSNVESIAVFGTSITTAVTFCPAKPSRVLSKESSPVVSVSPNPVRSKKKGSSRRPT